MIYYPDYLKTRPLWVLWKLEQRGERLTKVPFRPNGLHASSTNSETWSSFEEAVEAYQRGGYQGLGVMIVPPVIFLDFDHCVNDDGRLDDRGQFALETFGGTFIEVSQSGRGLHVFTLGNLQRNFKNSKQNVEGYSCRRFAALTGNAISATDLHSNQNGLDITFEKFKTAEPPAAVTPGTDVSHVEDFEARLSLALKNDHFRSLWNGARTYASQSEADFALCLSLAFWFDRDPAAIEAAFTRSPLCRDKWIKRADYRERTIRRACALCTATFTERRKARNDELIAKIRKEWC